MKKSWNMLVDVRAMAVCAALALGVAWAQNQVVIMGRNPTGNPQAVPTDTSGNLGVSQLQLYLLLNGTPVPQGKITETAGTPQDNTTSSTAFTLNPPTSTTPVCYRVQCTGSAYVMPTSQAGFPGDSMAELYSTSQFPTYCFTTTVNSNPKITVDFTASAASGTCLVSQMLYQ